MLFNEKLTFFDAFCGTGAVADYFKQYYNIILNDSLKWSSTYSRGRVCAPQCTFEKLGIDPFEFLNGNTNTVCGFIYNNYAPEKSTRMYFTPYNAMRIDYFRQQIEQWHTEEKLTEEEYCFLLACLIESVSSVSNTAGVYGAFLKKWDSRALKDIVFSKINFENKKCKSVQTFSEKIEDIIEQVDCDILYLDPPYTQNQYGTQYHLLETLILDDHPTISKITGSRPTAPMRSDWSKEYKVNIAFDRILAKTKARYIILSYSNDGFMSKEYIEAAMKRYGKPETFLCRKIGYKKYQNWKSKNQTAHYEYLFFVEKKDSSSIVIESPLNYIGSKAKVIDQIKEYCKPGIDCFIDAFGGGFNVGINMNCPHVIYNDLNYIVSTLIQSFRDYDTYEYLLNVKRYIKKFGLSQANAKAYNDARSFYNSRPVEQRDPRLLFTIIMYGYQQQIRFNSEHGFNNPVGMRWLNDKVLEKLISFSRVIKEGNYEFKSVDYRELRTDFTPNAFVYCDPPYMLTTGSYNDGKRGFAGWNISLEQELFSFLDNLDKKGIPFMLSYVAEHKGTTNRALLDFIKRGNYRVVHLGNVLGISGSRRQEVLIVNYEI